MGVASHILDVDKLLWIPGEKTIFLPPIKQLSNAEIIALELERIVPRLKVLFERDDAFYSYIERK